MDLKVTFHNLMRKNILMKKCPNLCHKISGYIASLRSVAAIYNFIAQHNKKAKIERDNSKEYFLCQKKKIEENISYLADEHSKQIYTNLFFHRCTSKSKYVWSFSEKYTKQYLDEIISPNANEVFVDVGAFFGESTIAFGKYAEKKIKGDFCYSALIIEPDKFNFNVCRKNINKLFPSYFFMYENCGAGSNETTANFEGGIFASSKLSESGECIIKINTIDSLCQKHGIKPTYIKFDIEGAEQDALKGTCQTINLYKPRLAISIYHSDTDMVEIIQTIKNLYPFYKLYVRHYSGFFADTVLYCIPE